MCTKKHRLSGNERTKGGFLFEESLLLFWLRNDKSFRVLFASSESAPLATSELRKTGAFA
jgi:hypothetical protein